MKLHFVASTVLTATFLASVTSASIALAAGPVPKLAAAQAPSGDHRSACAGDSVRDVLVHRTQTCKFTEDSLRPLPFDFVQKPDPEEPGGGTAPARTFAYHPPGKLHPNDPRKGRVDDRKVYLPNIIFPLALPTGMHPHMNSQIYGYGGGGWGGKGAAGGTECDPRNYDPFKEIDNYCEVRSWSMPMCPSGTGHQGQDIRPPTCADAKWEAVAVVDGIITRVTTNTTVVLKGNDGTSYYYLHMHPNTIKVKRGQSVRQGDVLGKVSKYMGGKRATTIHLHFMAQQTVDFNNQTLSVYVPVYTSLVAALRKAKGLGSSIDANGNLIVDANFEIGAKPVDPPDPEPPGSGPKEDPKEDPKEEPPGGKPEDPGTADELAKAKLRIAELEKELASAKQGQDTANQQVTTLTQQLDTVRQELNTVKVDSQRRIEAAESEARDARTALQQSEANLTAARSRIDQLDAEMRSKEAAAQQRERRLQARLDAVNVKLKQTQDRLAKLENEKKKDNLWNRTKKWWESVWDPD